MSASAWKSWAWLAALPCLAACSLAPGNEAQHDTTVAAASVVADAVDASQAATPGDATGASQGGALPVVLGGATDDDAGWLDWSLPSTTATLIHGPQGGYHLWVSLCVPESYGNEPKVALTMRLQASGAKVLPGLVQLTAKLVPIPGREGWLCRVGIPSFVDCPCEISGHLVRVRAAVTTPTATGWAEATIRPMPVTGQPCALIGKSLCASQVPPGEP